MNEITRRNVLTGDAAVSAASALASAGGHDEAQAAAQYHRSDTTRLRLTSR